MSIPQRLSSSSSLSLTPTSSSSSSSCSSPGSINLTSTSSFSRSGGGGAQTLTLTTTPSFSRSSLGGGGGGGGGGGIMWSTPFVLTFSLLLSLPVLLLVAPHIFPSPIPTVSPSDDLDDLALFGRAAATASARTLPSAHSHLANSPRNRRKIAFLFLTNTDLYFSPLWEKFFSTAPADDWYTVYVHADPTANVTRPRVGVFKDRFIKSAKRTARASPTLIAATRRLLAEAILDDPSNAFFAVLSQYCIPLRPFPYVYRALVESTTFDHRADPRSAVHGVRVKEYRSFIEVISREPRLWKRYVARGRYAMLPEVPFDRFRVGSQFFVLTRPHALKVVGDRVLWSKFRLPCYRADECYPEEHYFPTLLSMVDPGGCTRYTLTHVNWTGTVNGHPYTYRPGEISPALIRNLRISNYSDSYLFARKFSPDCLKPLMKIADKVIFRD